MTTFNVDELKLGGDFGLQLEVHESAAREALKQSLLQNPYEVSNLPKVYLPYPRSGVVLFTGCEPQELTDPHNPPEGVAGPYVIVGQHRFRIIFIIL